MVANFSARSSRNAAPARRRHGWVAPLEVLVVKAVSNLIRENKTFQNRLVLHRAAQGMTLMDARSPTW